MYTNWELITKIAIEMLMKRSFERGQTLCEDVKS